MLKNLFNLDKTSQNANIQHLDPCELVFYYHQKTKHHFTHYASSNGYLDWENQPNPFRRFCGSEIIELPFNEQDTSCSYPQLHLSTNNPLPVTNQTLGRFLEFSLAISAWKEFKGERWALRINPSSGNLHPTEGYLVFNRQILSPENLASQAVVCHYTAEIHSLEVRAEIPVEIWNELMSDFPAESFLVALSSVHWREVWKYGERAFRYCQHDVGHALAALRFSASLLGWQLIVLSDISDDEIETILGLNRSQDFLYGEKESPDLIAVVIPSMKVINCPLTLPKIAINNITSSAQWYGQANRLSQEQQQWQIIDLVTQAARKAITQLAQPAQPPKAKKLTEFEKLFTAQPTKMSAQQIIFQRRSAVAFDGETEISAQDFYTTLAYTMPTNKVPWDALIWPTHVHLCLFVHRVSELLPGLYILIRDQEKIAVIQNEMKTDFIKTDFLWQKPPLCPDDLPLYFLVEGNCQYLAKQVSCNQAIASDGAFSLGMVAEFEEPIRHLGAWYYRRLFWETGVIGQTLYLAAEAIGVRATGIGCFFDDPVHEVFGFQNNKYQSLYHFTVGQAVEDKRLTFLPPYDKTKASSNNLKQ